MPVEQPREQDLLGPDQHEPLPVALQARLDRQLAERRRRDVALEARVDEVGVAEEVGDLDVFGRW